MTIPRSVAKVLAEHVTLEVEGIDRMYLNVYIPGLQARTRRRLFLSVSSRQPVLPPALWMDPISKAFVAAVGGVCTATEDSGSTVSQGSTQG